MPKWFADVINISIAALLVAINGFFVAAEFALVKVREGRLEELVKQKRLFAATALWLLRQLDASLSACQLGITMASLGLGWIGEPAVAAQVELVAFIDDGIAQSTHKVVAFQHRHFMTVMSADFVACCQACRARAQNDNMLPVILLIIDAH